MDVEEENRGDKIIPSARRSIHSHTRTHISEYTSTMGKYGINGHKRKHQIIAPSAQEHGVDEVDNIMSKMAHPSSPLQIRKNNIICRRNSVDTTGINYEYSDDESDDENILSKSSPPSFSNFSEELYTSALNEEHNRNASKHSLNTSHRSEPIKTQTNKSCYNQVVMAFLVVIIATLTYNYYTYAASSAEAHRIYDKSKFYHDVKSLEDKYKIKYTSILQVKTGVATIYENQDAGSFIFTYNSENNHFNPIKFNSFVEDLAAAASKYLRNESKEVHVAVDTANLKINSVYEFMNEYRDGLDKTGVMLVKDLYNVPSDLAMAFHYYCDEYNPLVKKSAIFFTLNLSNCSQQDPRSTHDYIEKCLAGKWSSIEEDKIGPLLTRVVNVVIDVTSAF